MTSISIADTPVTATPVVPVVERNYLEDAKRIISIGEEVIGGSMLESLLKNKPEKIAYDGFEPSGRMHIAQGLVRTINTNKITQSGVKFKFWVADYFAFLNLKMGGNMERIKKAGELMIHTWKACGMDMSNVEFVWASEEINKRPAEYWQLVFDIATRMNIKRILRCTQIMGRKDFSEESKIESKAETKSDGKTDDDNATVSINEMISSMKTSQVFYPIMQCADIFFLNVDICSLGMDQRKVNMLAIEYCEMIRRRFKPIIVSHHMMMGLDGSDKMAKSNPDFAIFMDDTEEDIKAKIKKAYCVPGKIEKNPILEYFKYIVFQKENISVDIPVNDRKGDASYVISYKDYDHIEADYSRELIHPSDLKSALVTQLNILLSPVRKYFEENPEANSLRAEVKSFMKK